MDNTDLQIKVVESKEDVTSAISFLNTVLSHQISEKLWKWEFSAFPDKVVITSVQDEGRTVGTQFMLPFGLVIRDEDVLSGKCENSFFDGKYRGSGLFKKLFDLAEQLSLQRSQGLLWAFTGAVKVYTKVLGFTAFNDIMYNFSMPVAATQLNAIGNGKKSLGIYARYCHRYVKHLGFNYKLRTFAIKIGYTKLEHKFIVQDSPRSFSDFDQLYNDLKQCYGAFVHIKMDSAFFKWRITDNFNLEYVAKYFYSDQQLVGYYILSVKQSGAHISDFTSLNDNVANFMICHLLKEISVYNVPVLTYFGNRDNMLNKRVFQLLLSFGGGMYVNDKMPFVYKSIPVHDSNDAFLSSSQNWYLNGLWTEGLAY